MYLQYRAMTIGSGALLNDSHPHNSVPIGGALAVQDAPRPTPRRHSRSTSSRATRNRASPTARTFSSWPTRNRRSTTYNRPRPPPPRGAELYRARQTALGNPGAREQVIDTVALPARQTTGEDGILVYLIASTKKSDIAVLGRDHRVLVSGDGKRVLQDEPLSRGGLLELPMPAATCRRGAQCRWSCRTS